MSEEKLKYEEMHGELNKVLDTLPKRCKEIFVLSRLENLSNNEIADKFGISKRTMETSLPMF